jgi:ComF family protein
MASVLHDIGRFLYPHSCLGCGYDLFDQRHFLCLRCLKTLPVTGFEKSKENYVAKLFTGRLPIERGAAWLFFGKDGLTQKLIHQVKYRGNTNLGEYLGFIMGNHLKDAGWFNGMDILVPLPLNKKKLKIRGFNQSEVLCRGISKATGLPVEEVAVMRTVYTQTQTKKSRLQRWSNVEHVFDLQQADMLEHKHVVLVDDVMTTGATMDACGQVLSRVPGLKLSVLSFAVADRV